MRLGCFGCLGTIICLLVLLSLAGAGLWLWGGLWGTPPMIVTTPVRADWGVVERKLGEIRLRASRRTGETSPIVLTEAEVAAFLSDYLAGAGSPLSPVAVRLRRGQASLQGRLPFRALLAGSPVAWLDSFLPQSIAEAPVWITAVGQLALGPPAEARRPRYADVALLGTHLGRVPTPGWLLLVMLGPRGSSLLRWQVPEAIDQVELGEGRLTIRTFRSR